MNSLTENTGDFNRSLYSISESQLETAARGIAKARAALAEAQAIARQKLKAQELAHKETTQAIKEIKRAEAALAEAEAWEATQGNPSWEGHPVKSIALTELSKGFTAWGVSVRNYPLRALSRYSASARPPVLGAWSQMYLIGYSLRVFQVSKKETSEAQI